MTMIAEGISCVALLVKGRVPSGEYLGGGTRDVWSDANPGIVYPPLCSMGPFAVPSWVPWRPRTRKNLLFGFVNYFLGLSNDRYWKERIPGAYGKAKGSHTIIQGLDLHYVRKTTVWLVTFYTPETVTEGPPTMIITGRDLDPNVIRDPRGYL